VPKDLRRFAESRSGVEAVIQRVGRDTVELILVDEVGDWAPEIFASEEQATSAARALGVPVHDGWTEGLSLRVGNRNAWTAPDGKRRAL